MTAKTARTPETEREREERRAEQRRGEREREREERERERGEKKGRTTQKQTQKDSAFHEQRGESGRQRLPAPINSCCNGIRDNLKKVEKARLSFFAKRVLIGSLGTSRV